MHDSPFNPDELAAQTLAGGGPRGHGVQDFNRYFNTLGNLIAEPRASLLFVDFATGDLLRLRWSFIDYSRTTTATGLWH